MKIDMGTSVVETRQSKKVEFCTWENGLSTIVDDKLYLSSGSYRTTEKPTEPIADMGGKHDVVIRNLSDGVKVTKWPRFTISKPSNVPSYRNSAIWSSEETGKIYEFGGLVITDVQRTALKPSSLNVLDLKSGNWEVKTDLDETNRRFGGGYTQGNGKGFYYKGKVSRHSTPSAVDSFPESMLVFDMENEVFKEMSAHPDAPKALTYPTMTYAPYGKKGTVLVTGGLDPVTEEHYSYDVVDIFNIDTGDWYRQNATGDIPPVRSGQCSVSVSSPDGSSHQTFVYGGHGPKKESYDHIYVLSVPSFTWQKVWELPDEKGFARTGVTCSVHGSKMITIGGTKPKAKDTACDIDNERDGINIFDLTDLEWISEERYNKGDYQVSDSVAKVIGGDGKGGATKLEPELGWSSEGLKEIFAVESESAGLDGAKTKLSSKGGKGKGKGAVIGGAVGGILAALIIIAIIVSLVKRRKKTGYWAARKNDPDSQEVPFGARTELAGSTEADKTPVKAWADDNHQQQTHTVELANTMVPAAYPPPQGYNHYNAPPTENTAYELQSSRTNDSTIATSYGHNDQVLVELPPSEVAHKGQAPIITDPTAIAERQKKEREAAVNRGNGYSQ
ncbi:hypothetical protein BJ508DRAFT_373088 [Ascobolus immersus RN42]|uniref:Galactose oxidase n=1 Tax=Ascobolus immersus RN42 TaxID=1160509 RepID=A0A3N4IXH2_ASCIM|nr:hypothetical protein BJ508DRAFT_373088 [Ascobolus immersus RN42]